MWTPQAASSDEEEGQASQTHRLEGRFYVIALLSRVMYPYNSPLEGLHLSLL